MMFEVRSMWGEGAHQVCAGRRRYDVNGTTNFDRTNYFETMPSNQLEMALCWRATGWLFCWRA